MLKRGFKSWCENAALGYRKELKLAPHDPLAPHALAAHLNVKIFRPDEIRGVSPESLDVLLAKEPEVWSAVTITFDHANVIIYNSSHAFSRQTNDIMHELSHIIIGHQPQSMQQSYEFRFMLRYYNQEQEMEADCLAATLLLPREALIKIKFRRAPLSLAAREYGTSQKLLNMRMNIAGVNYIYSRSTRR